jgi:hypothetical protein
MLNATAAAQVNASQGVQVRCAHCGEANSHCYYLGPFMGCSNRPR